MAAPFPCPACGTAIEERRELGVLPDPQRSVDRARFECGGCRAIVGRDFALSAAGPRAGREPSAPATVVMTGAAVTRQLAPMESRARAGDHAGVLDELRALERDEERPFLAATEAVQRLVRGMPLRLVRAVAIPVRERLREGAAGAEVTALLDGATRVRLQPARLTDELDLTADQLDDGGVFRPRARSLDPAQEAILLLAGTRVVAAGAEPGLLRLAPPDPRPALREWGAVDALLASLNVVAPA